jgi:hypothetical protein
MMDELYSVIVSEERLEDCRDVIEPDLQDLIERTIGSGFTREEVAAEDFAAATKIPSVH